MQFNSSYFQIFLVQKNYSSAARDWINSAPKQQRRRLPSLLYSSFFYDGCHPPKFINKNRIWLGISYFLSDDLVEKQQKEVVLHDVDPLALTLLVEFAYTGEILITEENVQVSYIYITRVLCFRYFLCFMTELQYSSVALLCVSNVCFKNKFWFIFYQYLDAISLFI